MNLETNDTSFESPNIEVFVSEKKLGMALIILGLCDSVRKTKTESKAESNWVYMVVLLKALKRKYHTLF